MFAIYVAALTVTLILVVICRNALFRYAYTLVLLSWVLTRLWRVAVGDPAIPYLIIDAVLIAEFGRQFARTRLKLFRTLAVLHACFPALHIWGVFFDMSADFLGAERSNDWMQAFWRNRIFDAVILTMWAWAAQQLFYKHTPAGRRALQRKIDRLTSGFWARIRRAISQF